MNTKRFTESSPLKDLSFFIEKAKVGSKNHIDEIMAHLDRNTDFVTTRNIDYSLSLVENRLGIKRIKYYLFRGNQVQRNYACLFFNRKGEKRIIRRAYRRGKIDSLQAFSR